MLRWLRQKSAPFLDQLVSFKSQMVAMLIVAAPVGFRNLSVKLVNPLSEPHSSQLVQTLIGLIQRLVERLSRRIGHHQTGQQLAYLRMVWRCFIQ